MKIGSLVVNRDGELFRSGAEAWNCAVVVCLDPFTLVSSCSTMRWSQIKPESVEHSGEAEPTVVNMAMRRLPVELQLRFPDNEIQVENHVSQQLNCGLVLIAGSEGSEAYDSRKTLTVSGGLWSSTETVPNPAYGWSFRFDGDRQVWVPSRSLDGSVLEQLSALMENTVMGDSNRPRKLSRADIIAFSQHHAGFLGLDPQDFVLSAGAACVLFGIRELTADIDVDVPQHVYDYVLETIGENGARVTKGGRLDWCDMLDVHTLSPGDTIVIDGIHCYTPERVLEQKLKLNRAKDLDDIAGLRAMIAKKAEGTTDYIIKAPAKTLEVWTIQMAKWRLARSRGVHLVDITAKSGVGAFAPDFDLVMAHKRGELSDSDYSDAYRAKMGWTQLNVPQAWESLLAKQEIAAACYCPPFQFCHRLLFVEILTDYLKDHGCAVIPKGELT